MVLGELAGELLLPITDGRHVTELRHSAARPDWVFEAGHVVVDPTGDGFRSAEADERLHDHRAVVGQSATELRAESCEAHQRLVEDVRTHVVRTYFCRLRRNDEVGVQPAEKSATR